MSTGTPRTIGSYEVREAIGQGGMASVYKAYQSSLDRMVAIKVISAALATETEFMERFRQEALAIARLNHPNILTVHDFGQDNGVPYLVMEFVDGATLADYLEDGLPQEQIDGLVSQIAAGLDYAHAHNIVHRDIKPQNVLVTRDGRAVLADFGLARMMESASRLTMSGGVVGTPEYMSPEQAAGRPTDHRTDIYALGVIVYEMVGGMRPFSAETPLGVLMKHLQEAPPPIRAARPDLPEAVEQVITMALAKKPEERYQTAGDLARAFRQALSGAAISAPVAAPAAVPPPPSSAVPSQPPSPQPSTLTGPPDLDMSKYAGLKLEATKTQPRMDAALTPPVNTPAPQPAAPVPARPTTRTCPSCSATIPPDVSICPSCMYMLPFEEVAEQPVRKEPERQEYYVNLVPYNLKWDPAGLAQARQVAEQHVRHLAAEGWELVSSLEMPGTFVQGRTASGTIVRNALLTLRRAG